MHRRHAVAAQIPRLRRYARALVGNAADADDLVQEVFVRVVQKISAYVHEGRFEAWLFRIATNLIRDRFRRAKRTPVHQSLDVEGGDGQPRATWAGELADPAMASPSDDVERREDVDRMQRALAELPPGEREAVMLRHFSQLSFAQVADVMCTPLGTALARVHRGLAKLRKLVDTNP